MLIVFKEACLDVPEMSEKSNRLVQKQNMKVSED